MKELTLASAKAAKTEVHAKMVLDFYTVMVHERGRACQQVSAVWLIRNMLVSIAPHETLKAVFGNTDIV